MNQKSEERNEMKKMLCVLLGGCMLFAMTAFGTEAADNAMQTASAYLDQSEAAAIAVTVDLSGGWSVEFARGAVYLYDGEITDDSECTAMLVTLDQELYEEYMADAGADDNHIEADDGVYFTYNENEKAYLASLDDAAFFLITASAEADMESIAARFIISLDEASAADEAEEDGAETDENPLVGTWEYRDEENDMGAAYVLEEDGTGTYTMTVGEEEVIYELEYEVEDGHLLVTYVNNDIFTEDDVFDNEFRFEDDGTLTIKDSFDEEMTFVK
jgi:hypothetical protein